MRFTETPYCTSKQHCHADYRLDPVLAGMVRIWFRFSNGILLRYEMKRFTETQHCTSRLHCHSCRNDETFRQSLMQSFDWDGTCPHGHPEFTLPPVTQQLVTASKAAGRAIKAAVSGERVMADAETVAWREAICSECEFWMADRKRCSKCGCHTGAKIRLSTEKCPEGKWFS
jgi:hypothetical protein